MTEAAAQVDKARSKRVIAARRAFLDAAAVEAERIGQDVDPGDRTGTQKHLLKTFIDVLELREQWLGTNGS